MQNLSIVITTDGSHTIKNEKTGDTYHSIHGAVQESNHVFIKHGLGFFLTQQPSQKIRILEIGFGTGLNALLTLQAFPAIEIEFTTLEPYPLTKEFFRSLNYESKETLQRMHECEWFTPSSITERFTLIKLKSTLNDATLRENYFDVVYFDAFAPNSQPELWTQMAFKKILDSMKPASVLTTYCAKGQVKRDLKAVGFVVESIPGPPGKREMIRAILA